MRLSEHLAACRDPEPEVDALEWVANATQALATDSYRRSFQKFSFGAGAAGSYGWSRTISPVLRGRVQRFAHADATSCQASRAIKISRPSALPSGIGTALPICRAIAVFEPTNL